MTVVAVWLAVTAYIANATPKIERPMSNQTVPMILAVSTV